MNSVRIASRPDLDALFPAETLLDQLDAAGLIELASRAAGLQAQAMARLALLQRDARPRSASADEFLTVDEAACLLRVTPEWVYRKAAQWPFATKLAPKVLRIQRTGL